MKGIKISTKLVAFLLVISIIAIAFIYRYSYQKTRYIYIEDIIKELSYITQSKKYHIERIFEDHEAFLKSIANSYQTQRLIYWLSNYLTEASDTSAFIFQNISESEKNYFYEETQHLENFLMDNEIENIILVSGEEGVVLYDHQYKNNIGTNLAAISTTKNDLLQQVWREVITTNKSIFRDFSEYLSVNNYISFWATPVFDDDNNTIGVVIIQIPASQINDITLDIKKAEETFEILVVGNDYLLRNNSQLYKNRTAFMKEIKTDDVIAAFSEGKGMKIVRDYRHMRVLSVYSPLEIKHLNWVIISKIDIKEAFLPLKKISNRLNAITISIIIALSVIFYILAISIIRPLVEVKKKLIHLCEGELPKDKVKYRWNDEIGEMTSAVNTLIDNLRNTANFANQIGSGDLTADYQSISEKDELGNSLMEMRNSLQLAADEEAKRKKEEEQRSWTTHGVAMFAEILRQNNDNIQELSYNIIKNMVEYLDANQGGMFLLNEEKDKKFLSLESSFAYNRQKFLKKKLEWGEGIIGACVQEGESIFLSDIPDTYIEITSGLGQANPRSLMIVPLKVNEEIFGALEVASFNVFEPYQVEFVEKVAESIGSTISTVRINMQTAFLLEESQKQAEKLAQQEEEMRQNLEEMQATQEELAREQSESKGIINALKATTFTIEYDLDGKIIDVNKPYLDLLELRKKDLIGKNVRDGVKFDNAKYNNDSGFEQMWEAVLKGEPQELISKVFNPEKKYMQEIWLYETYAAIINETGEPIKVLKIANDITDIRNKEAESIKRDLQQQIEIERLRADNDAKQQEILDKADQFEAQETAVNNMLPSFTLDPDGFVIRANENFLNVLDFEWTEIDRKHYKTFSDPEFINSPKHTLFWKQVKAGNPQSGEFKFFGKDKKEIFLFITFTPIYVNNEPNRIIAIALDTTESKIERNDLYGQIEALGRFAAITELTPDGTVIKINNMFEQVLGYNENDAIGKNHSAFVDEDTRVSSAYSKFWERLKKGDYISGEYFKISRSGNKIWMLCTLNPISDINGVVYKVVEVAFDISKYRK